MGFFALVAANEAKEYVQSFLTRGVALIERVIGFAELDLRQNSGGREGDFMLRSQGGVLWGGLFSDDGIEIAKQPIPVREWDLLRGEGNLHFAVFHSDTGEVLVSDEPPNFAQFRVEQILQEGPQVHLHSVFLGYTSPSSALVQLQYSPAQALGLIVYLAEPSLPIGNASLTRLLFAFFVYLFVTVVIFIGLVDRLLLSRIRSIHSTLPYFEKLLFQDRPLDSQTTPDPGLDEIGTYSREVFTLFLRAQKRTKELRKLVDSLEFREKRLTYRPYEFFAFLGTQLTGSVQVLTQFPSILQDLEDPKEQKQLLETMKIEGQKLWSLTQLIRSLGSPGQHDDFPGIFRYTDFKRDLQANLTLWGSQAPPVTFLTGTWDALTFDLNPLVLVHFWRMTISNLTTKEQATDISLSLSKIADRESEAILRFELEFSSFRPVIQKFALIEESGIQPFMDFLDRHEPVLDVYSEKEILDNPPFRYCCVLDLQAREIKIIHPLSNQISKAPPIEPIDPGLLKKIHSSDQTIRAEGLLLLLDQSREKGWIEIEQYITLCLGSSKPSCPYLENITRILNTLYTQEPIL